MRATARWRARSRPPRFRRLGTIRKAFGLYLRKGLPRRAGPLEWISDRRRRADPLSRRARSRRRRSRGPRDAARSRRRALRRARQCGAAQHRARQGRNSRQRRPARRRHAALARRALARHLRRSDGAQNRRAPIATSRRSTSPSSAIPKAGRERLDGVVLPTGSVRLASHTPIAELPGYAEGEWWVQDAAAALPARLLGAAPGDADRRALRRARRQERAARARRRQGDGGRPLGRAAEAPRRQFPAAAPRASRSPSPTR